MRDTTFDRHILVVELKFPKFQLLLPTPPSHPPAHPDPVPSDTGIVGPIDPEPLDALAPVRERLRGDTPSPLGDVPEPILNRS